MYPCIQVYGDLQCGVAHPHVSTGPSRTPTTTTTARSWRMTSGETPLGTSAASSFPCVHAAEMKPIVTQPSPTAWPSSCTRPVSDFDPQAQQDHDQNHWDPERISLVCKDFEIDSRFLKKSLLEVLE